MKYRKLRIAWSVWWGVMAVMVVVLWVRSYWWFDIVTIYNSSDRRYAIDSELGVVGILEDTAQQPIQYWSGPISDVYAKVAGDRHRRLFLGFGSSAWSINTRMLGCPHWFLAIVAMTIAALPWLRFSLRTLLIATTLVAVVMGLIVWMTRAG